MQKFYKICFHPDTSLARSSEVKSLVLEKVILSKNKDENVFVWINEEDHTRLISMEKGDNVKQIIRFLILVITTIIDNLFIQILTDTRVL